MVTKYTPISLFSALLIKHTPFVFVCVNKKKDNEYVVNFSTPLSTLLKCANWRHKYRFIEYKHLYPIRF